VATGNYKGYPDPSHIISVEEASGLLSDRRVVFLDARNYWEYVEGHIPGAVNLELYAFHWYDTSKKGLETFAGEMANLLGGYGIGSETQVIFYETNSGYAAARGVWLLEFLGNKRGRLLDGGLEAWRRNGGPLTTLDPEVHRAEFSPRLDTRSVCGLEEISEGLGKGAMQIVDTRAPGEYDGTYRRALRGGHVPGAVNIEWKEALRPDGSLKDAGELAELYGRLSPKGDVVTYCQSGYRAAHSWLVLRLLGFENARNYLGSWYEWGNSPSTRIES
jgi:thiosulfate/3-mercaptopyruvate sulfurtransferase